MNDFKTLLREYAQPIRTLAGSDESAPPAPAPPKVIDSARFLAELQKTRRAYRFWSTVCLIGALMISAVAVASFIWKPTAALASGAGVSVVGLLTLAVSQIKSRAQIEILIALAETLEPATLQTIVTVLARSLG
jgi:hypothetical protein